MDYWTRVLMTFFILLSALLVGKTFLIVYRMGTRKWPPSARYLMSIVQWDREAIKIGVLVLLSLVVAWVTTAR